jgi:hypothetical protein
MNKWPPCKHCNKYFPPTTPEEIDKQTCKPCLYEIKINNPE